MIDGIKQAKGPRNGPYCKALQRGSVGDGIDGRSREGKFLRRVEGELLAQIDSAPSFAQRLLVRRIAKMMLIAERLDEKLTNGNAWTPHDARTFGALNNAIQRALRDLGLKPASKAKIPSIIEIAARHAKVRSAE